MTGFFIGIGALIALSIYGAYVNYKQGYPLDKDHKPLL